MAVNEPIQMTFADDNVRDPGPSQTAPEALDSDNEMVRKKF